MNWKKLAHKLLFLPLWLLVLLTVVCTAALILVFVNRWDTHPLAGAFYALSFYTLSVDVLFCTQVLPRRYRQIRQKILANPLGNRYLTDRDFRAEVSLFLSLAVNLLYAGLNVLLWYQQKSWWFVVLAVYYVILSMIRFLLARHVRRHDIGTDRFGELKRARVCAWVMLLLNLFLSGAVLMMVYQNRGYTYPGMMIYVMAAYTFYSTSNAIIDLVKYRKFESPVLSASKEITLAAALVSMLNLESAMFAEFGATMARDDQQLMIMLTGAGISIGVIGMAVGTIVRCTKEMRKCEHE